jgi:hypothetical protein
MPLQTRKARNPLHRDDVRIDSAIPDSTTALHRRVRVETVTTRSKKLRGLELENSDLKRSSISNQL